MTALLADKQNQLVFLWPGRLGCMNPLSCKRFCCISFLEGLIMQKHPFNPQFPSEALMGVLGGAVKFIHDKNQTPVEMCACSVLSAAALVCQGLVDVCWREGKRSPTSLNITVEAESGERKSANDDIAYLYIRKFDRQQESLEKASHSAYASDHALWMQKVKQMRKLVAKLTADDDCTVEVESRLQDLITNKPKKRKFARMLLVDTTQPALADHLANVYPYGGLNTDEGTGLFKSGVFRDYSLHNKLWDEGNWSSRRLSRGRIDLYDCRFSCYMQIQPNIMDGLIAKGDNQYHTTGYSSRALHVYAKSTQGERIKQFVEDRTENIEEFHVRMQDFLARYAGPTIPCPSVVTLSKAASELLVYFSRQVEVELREGGRFRQMRSFASKIAENAARIAAILHTLEKMEGPITVDVMRNAIKLAAWFLNQYRMRFCPRSQLELDMISLSDFITDKIAPRFVKERSVPGPYLCRYAPRHLRQVDHIWEVLKALEACDKLKVCGNKGSMWWVHLASWFPPPPLASPVNHPDYPVKITKFDENAVYYAPPEPEPEPDTSANGYELWPGVFLG